MFVVFDPENRTANGRNMGKLGFYHAPVGFSFIDCFARRETDQRPSRLLFSSEGLLLKKIIQPMHKPEWCQQVPSGYCGGDTRSAEAQSVLPEDWLVAQESGPSQSAGEDCRLASELIRSPVMGSSSNGGPPFTFSVFRCTRRAALSFFFCERANSF
jgi:hypothetical protein